MSYRGEGGTGAVHQDTAVHGVETALSALQESSHRRGLIKIRKRVEKNKKRKLLDEIHFVQFLTSIMLITTVSVGMKCMALCAALRRTLNIYLQQK
ncbi:MAG: hypothetical protein ACHQQQ_03555 [Bacteroidota bacterium]